MMIKILDPKFKYRTSEQTKEPGYLRRRFAEIRRNESKPKTDTVKVLRLAKRASK